MGFGERGLRRCLQAGAIGPKRTSEKLEPMASSVSSRRASPAGWSLSYQAGPVRATDNATHVSLVMKVFNVSNKLYRRRGQAGGSCNSALATWSMIFAT